MVFPCLYMSHVVRDLVPLLGDFLYLSPILPYSNIELFGSGLTVSFCSSSIIKAFLTAEASQVRISQDDFSRVCSRSECSATNSVCSVCSLPAISSIYHLRSEAVPSSATDLGLGVSCPYFTSMFAMLSMTSEPAFINLHSKIGSGSIG